ncbi:restriction endonuclease subunit S [Testudinibacter sp. TR-2022]|uniref:restriction endonuclease subunit S n=1 Tax=Testudinibacter sp. TR-2022 TaxID=2585029 RepID=UPI001117FA02|nr:restriction endonuclease subunit S [Testudinibacter sp. TR-2022]TNH06802.1 restriction endonuclease subunit S [Pasteurellaceae bacterium Phil11]TNH24132.1 restriction endonuclease subunit S [Testudinibacter sp. TR-2022]TNH27601.1 restriction endonuclease subunit S [Testudinibacter sp. TR-2022]
MAQLYLLSDFAQIHTGFTFRGKVEEAADGNAHLVQIKDARSHWQSQASSRMAIDALPKIHWQGKSYARAGSVLLPSRGEYVRASCLQTQDGDCLPIVASSQFFIINAGEHLLPEYLCWLLNQPAIQHRLQHDSRGSNIPMLNIGQIGELKLPIPDLSTQQNIVALERLAEQEYCLLQKLQHNRQQQSQAIYQKLIKEHAA